MNIGENIKKYRILSNLSRKDLAKIIGVSEVSITRYENNTREPNIETLNKIASAFGIKLSQLIEPNIYNVFSGPGIISNAMNKSFDNYENLDNLSKSNKDLAYEMVTGNIFKNFNPESLINNLIEMMYEININGDKNDEVTLISKYDPNISVTLTFQSFMDLSKSIIKDINYKISSLSDIQKYIK